jgi:hypothetical protein
MSYELSPINTTLLPEFQAYSDQYGLITDNNQGNSSGNGLLFTAHYIVGLVEKGLINEVEKNRIAAIFAECEKAPGLFIRSPVQTGYEAQDDLIGIMGAEAKLNPAKINRINTQNIYAYGHASNADRLDPTDSTALSKWALRIMNVIPFMKNRWNYNPVSPGTFSTKAWLGYRRDVVATIKMAAGQGINPFDWLYWAISMVSLTKSSSNNAYILAMHSGWAVEGKGWLTDWIVGRVQAKVKAKYGDFGGLLATYYQDQAHPLIKLLKNVIV